MLDCILAYLVDVDPLLRDSRWLLHDVADNLSLSHFLHEIVPLALFEDVRVVIIIVVEDDSSLWLLLWDLYDVLFL